jgi:hypothetical protein
MAATATVITSARTERSLSNERIIELTPSQLDRAVRDLAFAT